MHSFSKPKTQPVRVSIDETSIRLRQDGGSGFLVDVARRAKRTPASLARNVKKSQLRGSFMHVAMVADDPNVQPLLPQFIVLAEHQISAAEFAGLVSRMPSVVLVRGKKAWMNAPAQDAGCGFLVDVARRAKRTPASLTRSVKKAQLRGSFAHVAMVADDPSNIECQPSVSVTLSVSVSRAASRMPRAACREPRAACCELRVASCEPRAAIACREPRAASCERGAACCDGG